MRTSAQNRTLPKLLGAPYRSPHSRLRQIEETNAAGFDLVAIQWVACGERGTSSETVFSHLTGIALLAAQNYDLPHDPSDFGRCRKLLESIPDLVPSLYRLSELGPRRSVLVDRWQELADLMDREAPQWRLGQGSSPRVLAALQQIANQ